MAEVTVERRQGSRAPLRIILIVLIALSALWLYRLYNDPTWSKIGSFVLGYFLGSFIMDWIHQRASRGLFGSPLAQPPVQPASSSAGGRAGELRP